MIKKSCSFTGHRPRSLPFGYNESDPACLTLKDNLARAIAGLIADGYRDFYCGMAEGVDIWAAEKVLWFRAVYPDVRLHAVIPYPGHASLIGESFRERYDDILSRADSKTVVCERYSRDCFKVRNYYLVDACDTLIAVYNPNNFRSGTGQTVRYAQSRGKRVIILES